MFETIPKTALKPEETTEIMLPIIEAIVPMILLQTEATAPAIAEKTPTIDEPAALNVEIIAETTLET